MFFVTEEEDREIGIVVQGPSEPVTHPDKRAEIAAEKALEEERVGVLEILGKVGTYFGASMLVVGISLLCVFAYVVLTGFEDWIVISFDMPFLGLLVWILAGIANLLGGLLLMGSK